MTDQPQPSSQRAHAAQPHDDTTTPRDVKLLREEQQLVIEWRDGRRSAFPIGRLRRECPCATCRTERDQEKGNPLKVLKADPTGVRATSAKLVGNYAIRLVWSDGHDTGIFDFRFLRSLDAGES